MKKIMSATLIGLTVGMGIVNAAKAEERAWAWSPLGVGIAAPIQLPYTDSDIYGLRFDGLYGYNAAVYGVDFGLVARSRGDVAGLQGSAFNWTEGDFAGVRVGVLADVSMGSAYGIDAGLVNVTHGEFWGLAFGAINYATDAYAIQAAPLINWNASVSAGLQVALANADQDDYTGLAVGAVNYAATFSGMSVGFVNTAEEMAGFQLGVFNACDRMHGVQIGLVNMITESKRLPIMILANASF